jgi:ribosomal-protein-alanine N-acetyltransferase
MDEGTAGIVVVWQYPAPYDLYNTRAEDVEASITAFLDPAYEYYKISDENGDVLAYFNFGVDARVGGGDYSEEALDIGLGLRPDLTGQGYGAIFMAAVLQFADRGQAAGKSANIQDARQETQPNETVPVFRVTIAAFNTRAQHLWQKAGFCLQQSFRRQADGMEFLIFTRSMQEI